MFPSISVLLTTIGRPELNGMLKSLEFELNEYDNLYIVVDGKQFSNKAQEIISKYKFKGDVQVIIEEETLGYWGHAIRNKHQKTLKGDYILHADDDDTYLKNSFDKMRKYCAYKDKIVFFRFILDYSKNMLVWKSSPGLSFANIGTPSGLIPNIPEKFGVWEYRHGGDYDFYCSCKFEHIFVDELIYCVKPIILGSPDL